MQVIGSRAGYFKALRYPDGDHLEDEGLLEMHYVGPLYRLLDDGEIVAR